MQALQTLRIGQGFDIHQLVDGRPLIIGGVTIPYPKGLLGHSDADVLLHALIDALLGAMGLGDIGRLFPDTDGQWKDVDSRHLVRLVQQKMQALGWEIINIDATIHAEAPKIKPYVAGMIENIAHDLGVDVGQLNIKGKTNEKLGHLGRGEGIAAQVVALLFRRPL